MRGLALTLVAAALALAALWAPAVSPPVRVTYAASFDVSPALTSLDANASAQRPELVQARVGAPAFPPGNPAGAAVEQTSHGPGRQRSSWRASTASASASRPSGPSTGGQPVRQQSRGRPRPHHADRELQTCRCSPRKGGSSTSPARCCTEPCRTTRSSRDSAGRATHATTAIRSSATTSSPIDG